MAFFDILAHVSIRRCFKKLVTSAGVADTYKMCDSKMLAPCVIIITHQGADFPHHHHHHHRCMLDVGRCPQTSPLCPDPSIRLAELFFSYILSSLDSNTLTLGDVTTSSDKEFHGFTTLTAKLFLRNSRPDVIVE